MDEFGVWGRSHLGQLGRAPIGEASRVPVTVEGIADAVAISAGSAHSCALIADGTIRCWASNETGQLGRDLSLRFSHTTVAVDLRR